MYLLLAKFTNSGNQPIKSDDYERPLNLSVEAPARVLTAQVAETDPSNLLPDLLSDGAGGWCSEISPERALDSELRAVSLRSALLNPGDSFTIKLLASQFKPGRLKIDGRIVGVKSIEMAKESRIKHLLRPWMWLFPLFAIVLLFELAESPQPFARYMAVTGFALFLVWATIEYRLEIRRSLGSIGRRE